MVTIRCKECGQTLTSTSRHDFKCCGCPNNAFIDGGDDYTRMGAVDPNKLEIVDPIELISNEKEDGL